MLFVLIGWFISKRNHPNDHRVFQEKILNYTFSYKIWKLSNNISSWTWAVPKVLLYLVVNGLIEGLIPLLTRFCDWFDYKFQIIKSKTISFLLSYYLNGIIKFIKLNLTVVMVVKFETCFTNETCTLLDGLLHDNHKVRKNKFNI